MSLYRLGWVAYHMLWLTGGQPQDVGGGGQPLRMGRGGRGRGLSRDPRAALSHNHNFQIQIDI